MRVLLAGPDLEENLSLRFLAAALRQAGHSPTIATFDGPDDVDRVRGAAAAADLIALSMCYQIRAREYLALARALKADAPQRPVVVGGHYASCAAEALLRHHPELDLVVIHEGEHTLVELAALPALSAEALAAVPGIVYRDREQIVVTRPREIVGDLDSLPWADRSGPARLVAGVPTAYLMGSRGCVGDCDYCCITTLHRMAPGKRFRQRSTDDIVREMAWLYHERGVRQFVFHDDNFLVPKVAHNQQRVAALDRGMRQEGLRHVALVLKCRPADVHEEVFRRLREMGLVRVFMGIESGSAPGLASIGRRQQTVADAHRALGICEELEISTQYTMILVHPDATAETIRADLAFVRQHPAHPMSYCRAQIYAGTPLEQRMLAEGRARGDYLGRTYDFADPVTAAFWSTGQELFWDRCFSQQHLQGQCVRLDHLMAVARHAYEGRQIDALVAEFLEVQRLLNEETVALFEELLGCCEQHPDASSAALRAQVEALGLRETTSRIALQARVCALREQLQRITRELVGLPLDGPPAQAPRRGGRARHAAAVLLAVGAIGAGGAGCVIGDGVYEAPPYDGNMQEPDGAQADGSGSDGSGWTDDGGVFEAPPYDAGNAQPDGAQADGGGADGGWIDDGGVFEAPPYDAGEVNLDATAGDANPSDASGPSDGASDATWIDDGGVFEAPPQDS